MGRAIAAASGDFGRYPSPDASATDASELAFSAPLFSAGVCAASAALKFPALVEPDALTSDRFSAGGPECGSPTGAGAAGAAACAACAAIFASNSSCCFPASSWSLIASFTACGTSSSSIGSMTVQGSEFAGRPKGERSFPTCFALLRAQALSFFGWWRRYGIASARRAKGALEQWRDGRGDERPG